MGDLVVGARSGSGEPEKGDAHVPPVDGAEADGVVPDEAAGAAAMPRRRRGRVRRRSEQEPATAVRTCTEPGTGGRARRRARRGNPVPASDPGPSASPVTTPVVGGTRRDSAESAA